MHANIAAIKTPEMKRPLWNEDLGRQIGTVQFSDSAGAAQRLSGVPWEESEPI
jgi:hypothetical protein